MPPAAKRRPPADVRVRILRGSEIAMGPGKADLLAAIASTGSISAAARTMRMSYRRAWLLVQTINACFSPPLVEMVKGGPTGGGAQLTTTGADVLARYTETVRFATEQFAPFLAARPTTKRTPGAPPRSAAPAKRPTRRPR